MGPDEQLLQQTEFREAFLSHEQQVRIRTGKLACALVFFLMPFGVTLDFFVYPDHVAAFFRLRLLCSLLVAVVWALHFTSVARKQYPLVGLPIVLLPAFFITLMVYQTDAVSPYYAGLNLIMLAVSAVGHWSVLETLLAVGSVIVMYLFAYVARRPDPQEFRFFFNDVYFLSLTGIIVVSGNYIFNRLSFREFALRFELDRNKKALEESNQKLVELDQIKSRFFANISHELRTPLTLLLAPLETLMQRFNHSFDGETREVLDTMHSNGMRLLKLINDLLDLVRLESGRLEVKHEPLDVSDFVKGLASAARQVADDKRLRLETIIDPELGAVAADRDKLEKIVLNLVFNALKFTPAGGRVELRAQKKDDLFVITVSDTGMGISAKNLPFVFDRFWQADGTSKRKYQGVGIGLALVKELTEVQGGKVNVESTEGKGTVFTVQLPYQKADAIAKPEPTEDSETTDFREQRTVSSEEWLANLYRRAELFPAMTPVQETLKPVETARNGRQPKLLVADDEPDMLRFLKSQLIRHYEVIEAVDGQQAIEKASQFLPDIILLDMMMPEKDGLQACRELRERTSTQSIPIILLTARADEETKLAALSAGASDFLPKPFSTTELHVRIKNLVESHHFQTKLSKQNQALESTIEQLKETESQLVQTEKLASLGRMSAGIIHEINNPLNFATTGLYTLRNKGKYLATEQQAEYAEVLKDVEEGIKRVKTIVSDLRMFTHPDTESRDQVEVAEVVSSALRFLANEWKDRVQIDQTLDPHQTVWANKNKLIHVFTNLLQNSLDALKDKEFNNGEKPAITIGGGIENGRSIVRVRDNGPGIDAQHLDKIFDPFFTTKDVGAGMGLGLSICYRIVQENEGRIAVKTEVGKYCEFTLEFPAKG
ncbi:MAG TPA: ATP-binding protein [Verrucomicrobiae bacterium]|jgi:signal transduction histidine kinase|nr:ATP-binding protein [Verrucomicrobiae bacterium]